MPSRDRKQVLPIEVKLLPDDPVRFLRDLAFDRPIEDVIGNLRDVFGQFLRGDDLLDFRERRLVIGPDESLRYRLLLGERVEELTHGFIVPVMAESCREIFPPFSRRSHMSDDAGHECLILLFGVLFVEDAVSGVSESDAGEAILHIVAAIHAIDEIRDLSEARMRKADPIRIIPDLLGEIDLFGLIAESGVIHDVSDGRYLQPLRVSHVLGPEYVPAVAHIPALDGIFALGHILASEIREVMSCVDRSMEIKELSFLLGHGERCELGYPSEILFFGILDIVDPILRIFKIGAPVALAASYAGKQEAGIPAVLGVIGISDSV